ncbi:MAG: PQQ-binding-like beta-propeller repeat protein [Verrucomicrobiota bacterium]
MIKTIKTIFLLGCLTFLMTATAADWPQWRYDANRSANTPEVLPDNLRLVWKRSFPKREQVWDDPLNHDLMTYDRIFEPIVSGDLMVLNFNDSDKVLALDIRTGTEAWRFYTDGPIRFPAVANGEHVYFVSDDGSLYCLKTQTGELAWSFRGAPGNLKVIGNERVISAWPARGGPVIRDGTLYFASSIWPFMGTFIYALDAQTGHVQWVNDSTNAQYIKQPHNAPSFAGVAPQGSLVATEDHLIIPGGRSVPAVFDRHNGDFKYFRIAEGGKGNGGSFVIANEQHFLAHTRVRGVRAYDIANGDKSSFELNEPVLDGAFLYASLDETIFATRVDQLASKLSSARKNKTAGRMDLAKAKTEEAVKKAETKIANAEKQISQLASELETMKAPHVNGWAGNLIEAFNGKHKKQWEIKGDASGDLIKAGNRLYAAGKNTLSSFQLSRNSETPPTPIWVQKIEANIQRLLAANEMLFAVTLDGHILAFGDFSPKLNATPIPDKKAYNNAEWPLLQSKLDNLESKAGYALCFGLEDRRALDLLLHQTDFHIIGVDPDANRVNALRRSYDTSDSIYGKRIVLHQGDPLSFQASPYFASLVLINDTDQKIAQDKERIKAAYQSVRPYGGQLWITHTGNQVEELKIAIQSLDLEKGLVSTKSMSKSGTDAPTNGSETFIQVKREGALPGAADWTHQYGDIANTIKSDDQRVKLPLGLLWFGGSSNMDVLPRHGHGPPEQVIGGRSIIEGMDSLSARDVYTGRVIWKRKIENLDTYGIYYDETYKDIPLSTSYNQVHIAGANLRGSNYVATEDTVYIALENYCEVLDAETGKTIRKINLPPKNNGIMRPRWGFIGIYGDLLLGGHDFAHFSDRTLLTWEEDYPPVEDLSSSDGLVAFDRHTGDVLWKIRPRHGFIHNGIVAGNGRIYCLDKLPESAEGKMKRRGRVQPDTYRIAAYDAQTGDQLWETTGDIFGTWLSYSEEYDILLQAGSFANDRKWDEVGTGMVAYSGKTGEVIWKNLERNYTGPCIIHNDLILTTPNSYKTSAGAFRLLDGKPHFILNPLTQKEEPLAFSRAYGCNTPIAGEHMITFRSGAAGYYDMEGNSGTGNLGGFRSSCTSNLVIANGVLNAPDYTRTCTCGYQNQTSLALIHMPEIDMWTHTKLGTNAKDGEIVRQVGVNLGAPGDRRAKNGTLWLEFPVVGGDSPEIPISITGENAHYYAHHSSRFKGDEMNWVGASGVEHAEKITIQPHISNPAKEENNDSKTKAIRNYTVRLHFLEPEKLSEGDRIFDVYLQHNLALEMLDITKETKGHQRTLVKEFKGIQISDRLEIHLFSPDKHQHGTILSGIEIEAEQ